MLKDVKPWCEWQWGRSKYWAKQWIIIKWSWTWWHRARLRLERRDVDLFLLASGFLCAASQCYTLSFGCGKYQSTALFITFSHVMLPCTHLHESRVRIHFKVILLNTHGGKPQRDMTYNRKHIFARIPNGKLKKKHLLFLIQCRFLPGGII